MKIALFVTCVNNAMYPRTGQAVVEVLERLGHEVVFPRPQTCCGQLHLNAGYRPEGLALARSVVDTFAGAETIVVPSASCAETMRTLWAHSAEDESDHALAADAAAMAGRVYEFTELLVDVLGVTDVGAVFPHKVAYHPTCHSLRALRLGDRPYQLLSEVAALQLVDFQAPDECCGFGGLFAIKNPAISSAMGDDKLDALEESGAEYVCAADNSCLTHLGGLDRRRAEISPGRPVLEMIHLAEILASTGEVAS